jgi:hypothetical protein
VKSSSSSAFNELALVYQRDVRLNSDKAYPSTPGHFEEVSCEEIG